MASGILGAVNLSSAATDTVIYTVPASTTTTCSVTICNRGNSAVTVRLGLCASTTIANGEFIEYETIIYPSGVLERTGLVLTTGQNIVARSSALPVNVVVYGLEQ